MHAGGQGKTRELFCSCGTPRAQLCRQLGATTFELIRHVGAHMHSLHRSLQPGGCRLSSPACPAQQCQQTVVRTIIAGAGVQLPRGACTVPIDCTACLLCWKVSRASQSCVEGQQRSAARTACSVQLCRRRRLHRQANAAGCRCRSGSWSMGFKIVESSVQTASVRTFLRPAWWRASRWQVRYAT